MEDESEVAERVDIDVRVRADDVYVTPTGTGTAVIAPVPVCLLQAAFTRPLPYWNTNGEFGVTPLGDL